MERQPVVEVLDSVRAEIEWIIALRRCGESNDSWEERYERLLRLEFELLSELRDRTNASAQWSDGPISHRRPSRGS